MAELTLFSTAVSPGSRQKELFSGGCHSVTTTCPFSFEDYLNILWVHLWESWGDAC
jgi:hypothetical protein